jgi:nitrous oxidase accessory protein
MIWYALLLLALQSPGAALVLADRLAAARPGDTIYVPAGVHRGPIVIDRRLALIGAPGAVIDAEGRGTVLTMRADSAEVRGLTLRGGGISLNDDEAAIKIVRCTGCRVIDMRIVDALHGIYLQDARGVLLADNEIAGNARLVESRRGNGIHLFSSTGNRIERNHIVGTRDGMYFSFATQNVVVDNDVERTRYGLHYMYSDDNRFERNRFWHNAAGAAIMFSKRIVLRDNVFAEHVGYRAYGVLLQTAEEVLAERNRIEGNLTGLFLDGSVDNTFRANVIAGNGVGIDLLASAERNTFVDNAIIENRTSVRNVLGAGENTWAREGRGNYWGDRDVFDLDGDGIGDRPYEAGDPFATLAASRPVLDLFTGTPAAAALSWAERAFPVFDTPRVIDPSPLVRPSPDTPSVRHTRTPLSR